MRTHKCSDPCGSLRLRTFAPNWRANFRTVFTLCGIPLWYFVRTHVQEIRGFVRKSYIFTRAVQVRLPMPRHRPRSEWAKARGRDASGHGRTLLCSGARNRQVWYSCSMSASFSSITALLSLLRVPPVLLSCSRACTRGRGPGAAHGGREPVGRPRGADHAASRSARAAAALGPHRGRRQEHGKYVHATLHFVSSALPELKESPQNDIPM